MIAEAVAAAAAAEPVAGPGGRRWRPPASTVAWERLRRRTRPAERSISNERRSASALSGRSSGSFAINRSIVEASAGGTCGTSASARSGFV